MVRTSFRNIFGYALAASASFDEALRLMGDQLDDAERCRIDFAVPYALVTKALALTGPDATTKAPLSCFSKRMTGPPMQMTTPQSG